LTLQKVGDLCALCEGLPASPDGPTTGPETYGRVEKESGSVLFRFLYLQTLLSLVRRYKTETSQKSVDKPPCGGRVVSGRLLGLPKGVTAGVSMCGDGKALSAALQSAEKR